MTSHIRIEIVVDAFKVQAITSDVHVIMFLTVHGLNASTGWILDPGPCLY